MFRTVRHLLLFVLLVALVVPLGGPAAAAAGSVTVSGRVLDDIGSPVSGACVSLLPDGPTPHYAFGVQPDGGFSAQVEPGDYRVLGHICNGAATHAHVYLGGGESRDRASVITVGTEPGEPIAFTMPRAATLSGTLRTPDGRPAVGRCAGSVGRLGDDWGTRLTAVRDDGTWTLEGVGPGARRLRFGACSPEGYGQVESWYRNGDSYATADVLDVAPATTVPDLDAVLPQGGALHGRVLDDTGAPAADVRVTLMTLAGSYTFTSAVTDGDGRWRLEGLTPSVYRLRFSPDRQGSALRPRFYPAALTSYESIPVTVTDVVELPLLDVVLPRGADVSGRVTGTDGSPLSGACVYVEPASGLGDSTGLSTAADGTWQARAVEPGPVFVQARRCQAGNWAPRYAGAPDHRRPAPSAALVAAPGQALTGVDVELEPGASVVGRAVDSAGRPLEGLCMTAFDGRGQEDAGTLADGSYRMEGLPTSTEHYVISRDCRHQRYAQQYTGGTPFLGEAERLTLRAGQETDAGTTVMLLAGSVSGTVTDARTGRPVAGACVSVQGGKGMQQAGGVGHSDASGAYQVTGIAPGSYVVMFGDCGANIAAPVYWGTTATPFDAARVEVREGVDSAGIDQGVLLVTVPGAPQLPVGLPVPGGVEVTWSPPADDGSAPITGYEVVDEATRVLARAPATVTRTVVTGLAPDREHVLAVRALNRKGTGQTSATVNVRPAPLQQRTALTLTGPASVGAGQPARLVARLTGAPAPAGLQVPVRCRPAGSTAWAAAGTAVLDATGSGPLTVRRTRTAVCEARFAGAARLLPSTSALRVLPVTAPIRLTADRLGLTRGQTALLTVGSATAAGRRLVVQAQPPGGAWRDVTPLILDRAGRGVLRVRPGARGTWRYRAVLPASTTLARSASPVLRLPVR